MQITIASLLGELSTSTQSCYKILSKISQQKVMKHAKKQESITHTPGKKQTIETACDSDQMSNLAEPFKWPL